MVQIILYRNKSLESMKEPVVYESDDGEISASVVNDNPKQTRLVFATPKGIFEANLPKEENFGILSKLEEYRKVMEKELISQNFNIKLEDTRPESRTVTNWTLVVQYENLKEEELLDLPENLVEQLDNYLEKTHGYKK